MNEGDFLLCAIAIAIIPKANATLHLIGRQFFPREQIVDCDVWGMKRVVLVDRTKFKMNQSFWSSSQLWFEDCGIRVKTLL